MRADIWIGIVCFVVGLMVGWGVWGGNVRVAGTMPGMADMSATMHSMTAGLDGKTGDDLDKAFIDEMIIHHQGAVEMARMVLTRSPRPELRSFAQAIISAQSGEISKMQEWRQAWFK